MKTKIKLICIMLTLVMVMSLFSVFNPLIASALTQKSQEQELENSLENSEDCLEFIKENFSKVISEYNKSNISENLCKATYIESQTKVHMTDINKYGFYLDFDGNNGYLLITADYHLYEFEPIGELSYLKNVEFAYYNSFDKFMYIDSKTGTLERYDYHFEISENSSAADCSASTLNFNSESADGQDSDGGDGKIYNIDSYVSDVYPEYEYVSRYIMCGYEWIYQSNTSIYQRVTSDSVNSEGNCVINAIYSVMNDWYRRGRFQWLPSGTVDYYLILQNDVFYDKYGTNTYNNWTYNYPNRLRKIPALYSELRTYAINYGYIPESGMKSSYIPSMVSDLATSHGYTLNMSSTSSFENVKNEIDSNMACVVSVQGSSTFNNHSMGLYGYVKYEYTSGWWIFETTETKYFYVVDDGHSYKKGDDNYTYTFAGVECNVSYFDPNTEAKPTVKFFYLDN
ncbi:MAG: hypothetical protein IJY23_08995 [Clostridia bacterium]|nr:hypothetical protein [Clostridia bacterium]